MGRDPKARKIKTSINTNVDSLEQKDEKNELNTTDIKNFLENNKDKNKKRKI